MAHFCCHTLPAGRAPRLSLPVRGHMSGSTGRAPRLSFPVWGHMSGSAGRARVRPFRGGARPGRPLRPAWHGRQGTTGPGDALMVGIPAARLCFWNFENRLRIIHFCYCCQNSEWRFVRLQWTNTDFFDKIISGAKMANL